MIGMTARSIASDGLPDLNRNRVCACASFASFRNDASGSTPTRVTPRREQKRPRTSAHPHGHGVTPTYDRTKLKRRLRIVRGITRYTLTVGVRDGHIDVVHAVTAERNERVA